jgi:hypothetical protein
MIRLRRKLGCLTTAWLLCQATVTLVPSVLQVHADRGGLQCECSRGAAGTCAIHHQTASRSKQCVIRSVDDTAAVVLSSLFGAVGLVPAAAPLTVPAPAGDSALAEPSPVARLSFTPDPPPPRA